MLGAAALGALTSVRGFTIEFDGMVASMFGGATGDKANVLSTIPLFIYAGYLLAEAKTADRLVRFANAMLGWIPGGLAIVTIGTCALFTVFTGASGVTIIALGGVLMPALVRNGYPERFSIGLHRRHRLGRPAVPARAAAVHLRHGLRPHPGRSIRRRPPTGTPGGSCSPASCPAPGAGRHAVAVAVVRRGQKKLPRQKFELGELGRSFLVALPELFIPFGVILGLAKGFAPARDRGAHRALRDHPRGRDPPR